MADWVRARHIQMSEEAGCQRLIEQLALGADFESLARDHSLCTTARHGGQLGMFSRGQMGSAIDEVVFQGEVGSLYGPVESEYGFHIIQILEKNP